MTDAAPHRIAPARPSVVIGIPTYRRPAALARLLATLPDVIETALEEGRCEKVTVIVVDNDTLESARSVVAASPLDAQYRVESEPGVVAVRNRLLDAGGDCDLLAFVDDDETPASRAWLAELLRVRTSFAADAVAGPVRTVFDGEPETFLREGGFYDRSHRLHLRDGARLTRAATNNLLVDLAAVRRRGVRFDQRFARSGGEDSFFTEQLRRRGGVIVWSAQAGVIDHLEGERLGRRHALQRTRGMAAAGVRVDLALAHGIPARWRTRARAAAAASVRGTLGLLRYGVGALTKSDRLRAVGLREISRGAGAWDGAVGRSRAYYGGEGSDPSIGEGTGR